MSASVRASPDGARTPASFRRALVVRFGRIGDMLVVTPVLRALREAVPDVRIDVLTSEEGRVVCRPNGRLDRVHILKWRRVPRALNPERASLLRTLRSRDYDVVFLLENAERYQRLVRDAGTAPVFTFAAAGRPPGPRHAIRGTGHELENFFAVLALAGIPPAGPHYEFPIPDAAEARARALLAAAGHEERRPFIGVHAGHFRKPRLGRGPHAKTWPLDRWIALITRLAEAGRRTVVLTGSASERALNAKLAASARPESVIDLTGRTDLETLAAVIRRCAAFVASDTGPAHLAAAVDTPLVALFGPKDPGIMGPVGDESRIVRLYPEPSRVPEADRRGHHPRLWAIGVDDVVGAVETLAARYQEAGVP